MNFELMLIAAPIFLLIVRAHGLPRGGIPSLKSSNLDDGLVHWVLFPTLLFDVASLLSLVQ